MATVSTGTISDGKLKDANGFYFEGEDMATASVLTSSAIPDGGGQGGIEIVGNAATEVVIADGIALKVELKSATTETGDYTTFDTPYNVTGGTSGTTVVIDTELFRVNVPTNAGTYIKAVITSSASHTGTVDIYDLSVAR